MNGGEKMRFINKKLTDDPVLLRILDLLKEKGSTEKDMVRYLGIGNGAFTHWKYEGQKSFHQHIGAMAEYPGGNAEFSLIRGR